MKRGAGTDDHMNRWSATRSFSLLFVAAACGARAAPTPPPQNVATSMQAAEAFLRAARFAQANDEPDRRKAIWGRARAFALVDRCREARAAYDRYEAAVRLDSPRDTEMAAAMKAACRPR